MWLGTYDGSALRIYVDGKLEGERAVEGEIAYPDEAFYTIGVYRDKDERYPVRGKLRAVRVYGESLPPEQVTRAAKAAGVETPMAFAVQPALRFVSPTAARVTWEGAAPGGAAVDFGRSRRLGTVVKSEAVAGEHSVLLEGLEPETAYYYKIGWAAGGEKEFSPVFEFDTALNFSKPPVAGDADGDARRVFDQTGVTKGYALVFGDTALALGLARGVS